MRRLRHRGSWMPTDVPSCRSGMRYRRSANCGRRSSAPCIIAESAPGAPWSNDGVAIAGAREWVSGACLLVRRADLDAVGLLDERYFMYTEDVDLCVALRKRGRQVLFVPDAQDRAPARPLGGAQSRYRAPAPAEPARLSTRNTCRAWAPLLRRVSARHREDAAPMRAPDGQHYVSAFPLMRIAIDARKLHDFGIGTYIRNMLRRPRAAGSTEPSTSCWPVPTMSTR